MNDWMNDEYIMESEKKEKIFLRNLPLTGMVSGKYILSNIFSMNI